MIKRAQRLEAIVGFGIDRVAASSEEKGGSHGGPILRMENLDTDLPLPPEALEVTRAKLDDPKSNSWLPFTGDLDLRAVADSMRGTLLVDGRNFLDPDAASAAGLAYEGVGRPSVAGRTPVAGAAV